MSERVNLPNEVPTYVFSVRWSQPAKIGAPYWVIEELLILESSDSWIVVRDNNPPGITKLDRQELDLDGITVVGERIFYAARERAQRFINRWHGSVV